MGGGEGREGGNAQSSSTQPIYFLSILSSHSVQTTSEEFSVPEEYDLSRNL